MLVHETLTHAKKIRPAHVAAVDHRRAVTYSELDERVSRLSAGLVGELGLERQERFAVLSRNRVEFVEIEFAAARAGVVCVPLNYRLAPREITEIVADTEARVLFVEGAFEETVTTLRGSGYEGRVMWLDDEHGPDGLEGLVEGGSPGFVEPAIEPSDIVLQIYTSGTTGRPKGVMLSNRNLMANSWSLLAEGSAASSDRYLTTAPLCHLGAGSRIVLLVHATATHVIHTQFDAERVVSTMQSSEANSTLIVPAMLRELLDAAAGTSRSLVGSVRLITYGTAPMPVDLLAEALTTLGCAFQQGYGLTEASPNLTILPPDDHLPDATGSHSPRLASVGRETVGVQVRVVDPDDADVEPGEVGEVIARGANIMEGYWRRPKETAEALRGGWLRTGDLARVDDDGYVYLVGRAKDMLVSGGFNVYPREIEIQLEEHPAVAEAAVVGVPDERWGEVPVAFVVPVRDESLERLPEELPAFLDGRLARFKIPRRYEIVTDLPRNATGKAMKTLLREQALADRGAELS